MAVGSFLMFFILSCVIPATRQQDCCPNDYSLHLVSETQAICIRRFTNPLTFNDALNSCEMTSGASLLKLYPYEDVQVVVDRSSVHWIGLRRDPMDSEFRWTSDGTRLTLAPWNQNSDPPEPTDFDCVRVNEDLTWSAVSCDSVLNYICQVDVNDEVASCLSTIGEARRPCAEGFVKIDQQCQDINECQELSSPCNDGDNNVTCFNTQGSYNCRCNPGFSRESPASLCTANMECTVDSDCTGNNEVCRMSYDNVLRCQCVSGYTGATCVDIDECDCTAEFAECINVCENEECQMMKCAGNNEVCANTDGSFTCDCANGFVRNDRNFCVDIDECEEGMCSGNRQICTNTIGSFQCVCDPGYELQNLVCIESCLGRCNVDTEDCLQLDLSCVCKNGYFGSSGNCQDIDECGDSATCTSVGSNMVCSNTPGSFVCQCAAGFQLVGDQCVDINECDEGTHNCGSSPNCINTDGSFMCSCTEDERLVNGNCVALRSFRVKIVATELNNTIPGDPLTSRTLFTDHFCRVILDNLERRLPGIPEDCSDISFVGRVTGYLRVRMASASLAASDIESLLEANVVMDITGDLRIRSDDTQTTITIVDPGSDIDVADFTTDPCNPSPCQNNAPCIQDSALIESNCLCRSRGSYTATAYYSYNSRN
ncbi:Latent-transforming growth factor beta-binding protein 4 [Holothuria leucospilota]|uniref:Latent-transforming growth factor beta-binding protein 4 n=1 Tax=Holothuria leucospilota TaxID=206669 RepID=A0A9Q1H8K2_HOLLE|nr:Latent-transforming growth factor beta-binding protein 4 [Holothuria leucospilota]